MSKLDDKLELLRGLKDDIGKQRKELAELGERIELLQLRQGEVRKALRRSQRLALDTSAQVPALLHAEVSGFVGKVEPGDTSSEAEATA